MSREDAHKLLGGYATGTLTPAEQQALFEAALGDQELFDALAREQALREVLDDPSSRAHLLAALDEAPVSWYRRWWRPLLPVASVAAIFAVMAIVLVRQNTEHSRLDQLAKLDVRSIPSPAKPAETPTLPPPPDLAAAAPVPGPLRLPFNAPGPPPQPRAKAESGVVGGLVPPAPMAAPFRNSLAPGANSFLPSNSVPVRGVVTDPTGAAVRSATVELKSLTTGDVNTVATDERGEFRASEIAGSAYEVKATMPGFRPATATVTPTAVASAPVNLRLEVGSAAEMVEVADSKTLRDAAGGRGGRGGAAGALDKQALAVPMQQSPAGQQGQQAAAQAPRFQQQQQQQNSTAITGATLAQLVPTPASVRYRVLQKASNGPLVEIAAGTSAPRGADLILEVTSSAEGFVRVTHDGRSGAVKAVSAQQPQQLPLPKVSQRGPSEFRLDFFTEPPPGTTSDAQLKQKAAADAVRRRDAGPATSLTISVNFQ